MFSRSATTRFRCAMQPHTKIVTRTKNSRLAWLFIGLLVLFKLWLVSGQSLWALAHASHDDLLFIRLANHLAQLDWLGPYDNLTLSKGPFYPMWIACMFLASIPLLLSQHLLYIAADLVMYHALRPFAEHCLLRIAIFVLLLFNPATVDIQLARVLRDALYPGLTLLVVATTIGLFARRHEPACSLVGWAVTCGLATAAFWLTREEGLWILPLLVPLVSWTMAAAIFTGKWNWRKITILTLPLLLPTIMLQAVSLMNWTYYGVYATVEFKTSEYKAAYGALTRVQPREHKPQVPIPKETRQHIYEQSKAFKELQPFFERDGFWTLGTVGFMDHPSGSDEIGGGWFMWALRDAAADAGYFTSGAKAASFFQQIAGEVNAACEEKRLDCLDERATMMPPWRNKYLLPVVEKTWLGFRMLTAFSSMSSRSVSSMGSPDNKQLFQDLTREKLSDQIKLPRQARLDQLKQSLQEKILLIYQIVTPFLATIALLAMGVWFFRSVRNRKPTPLGFIAVCVMMALFTRLLILAIIDVTSFPAVSVTYMSPLYPLLLLCYGLLLLEWRPADFAFIHPVRWTGRLHERAQRSWRPFLRNRSDPATLAANSPDIARGGGCPE